MVLMSECSLLRVLPSFLVTIARRVDSQLNCVKGGGACHLREKVLAEAARTFVPSLLLHLELVLT